MQCYHESGFQFLEGDLKKSRFAQVNKLQDFVFTLLPGINVSGVYPGNYLSI